jgi:hypothetical protein
MRTLRATLQILNKAPGTVVGAIDAVVDHT